VANTLIGDLTCECVKTMLQQEKCFQRQLLGQNSAGRGKPMRSNT